MRLVQFLGENKLRQVGLVQADGVTLARLAGVSYVRDLALEAHQVTAELDAKTVCEEELCREAQVVHTKKPTELS